MFNPVSTYRIQFHKEFTFNHLERIIPYLIKLGVKTIYASPIFKSVPGSTHGYDGVDPLTIDPEIGTLEQLQGISKMLKANNIGWLQDIVPNHMAFHNDNPWLMDVLENGPSSPYKNYFDQQLADGDFFSDLIMVPFLGSGLKETIENGELSITIKKGKLKIAAAGQLWPLNAQSQKHIFESQKSKALSNGKTQKADLAQLNTDKALLKTIAEEQYYRLCSWQETDHQINFRRFFTVNGLICLNMQRQDVFDHFHQLIKSLLQTGIIQGLRVDHIDGLYDPEQYLQRLRAMAGDGAYIVVEKILEPGETMERWPIQGNTGYDFLAIVNNLFTTRKSEAAFNQFYQSIIAEDIPVHAQIEIKKAHILSEHMAGELDNLTTFFSQSNLCDKADLKGIDNAQLKRAIAGLLIKCPVYRFYGNQMPLPKTDRKALKNIFESIINEHKELAAAIKILQRSLLKNPKHQDNEYNQRALKFYQRCMQFTGPLMAKGVEDTLMYTYNRFIDHNEVGDAPDAFGISVKSFHKKMQWRQKHWPLSINSTATHDTKRGEDARARLNVLTNMPDEWISHLREWQKINFDLKNAGAPDANDELFIYQTLIGTYPMPGQNTTDFSRRLSEYLQKALREGKQHSNWAEPNTDYELSVQRFASELLNKTNGFWTQFTGFHQKVSDFGIVNSLAQTLLKFTCPGVPDVYQGCEHWDFSMVDPDNRRPVNYKLRQRLLNNSKSLAKLWNNRFDGHIKVKLVETLLKARAANPLLFTEGEYLPLQVTGEYKHHILAFARKYRDSWLVVVTPLNTATICAAQQTEINQINWTDTAITLPAGIPGNYQQLLSKVKATHKGQLLVKDVFKDIPVAVLQLDWANTDRACGVLMHITSLPSKFAIGDLGPEARDFADSLHYARQTYWQVLPINPTIAKDGHSPYSAYASRAGNTLLISPDLLTTEGLISKADIDFYSMPNNDNVDFEQAARIKNSLLDIAWHNFTKADDKLLHDDFDNFCKQEANWLDDYALFTTLKQQLDNKPWHQWPARYKKRDAKSLNSFINKHSTSIAKAKWLQYIFDKQWHQLKAHCNGLGICLFGDLPFYMSYDSVDVWVNPEYFSITTNYTLKTVAGVPPDYFNADGQLWGMPVYDWAALKANGYQWWVDRIRKNTTWFNLLRLDHFRAFAAYWAVPAAEQTAINGTWEPGPGIDLFNTLKKELGDLPFVAEDLGEIDEPVRLLRKQLNFPGMKVLHFAFGDTMPYSEHAPHHHAENYLVYTGTHDNNTTRGWFGHDIDEATVKQVQLYAGKKVTAKNVSKVLVRLAYQSTCKIAIIPIQDLLNLDNNTRMNTPASTKGNWEWRLTPEAWQKFPAKFIKRLAKNTNR